MKKMTLSLLGAALFLISCGGGEETTTEESTTETSSEETVATETTEEVEETTAYPDGEAVYNKTCMACHQADGNGIPGSFPPLASSDYLLEDVDRAINQVINGSEGEIVVNGETYTGVMPAQVLTDQEVVDVLNYVLNSWGNDGGEIAIEDVQRMKEAN